MPVELNQLIQKLDKRTQKVEKNAGIFVRRSRVESIDSTSSPPLNAPKWTLKIPRRHSNPTTEDSTPSSYAGSTPTSSGLGVLRRRLRTTSQILDDTVRHSSTSSSGSSSEGDD